ncbi:unnamed protein product [marine sediment metagenome]|uniref:Uncharacterized protein n=1 Tax=marine sediment metagenome TaxID=412755 RepID=X1NK33_9ZZZZ
MSMATTINLTYGHMTIIHFLSILREKLNFTLGGAYDVPDDIVSVEQASSYYKAEEARPTAGAIRMETVDPAMSGFLNWSNDAMNVLTSGGEYVPQPPPPSGMAKVESAGTFTLQELKTKREHGLRGW